jgi:4-guanidinobutyraldehyde dehydrogenase/NAD-dependent aldehyde dehydrogenase
MILLMWICQPLLIILNGIQKLFDDISPSPKEYMGLITKESIGVVAAIVPWNYPLWMAIW